MDHSQKHIDNDSGKRSDYVVTEKLLHMDQLVVNDIFESLWIMENVKSLKVFLKKT